MVQGACGNVEHPPRQHPCATHAPSSRLHGQTGSGRPFGTATSLCEMPIKVTQPRGPAVRLDHTLAARLSHFDAAGRLLSGDAPTKEAFLHFSMYGERSDARAVVHLHSSHATAVSILRDVDPNDVLPALTAYYIMRVGRLPLVPYFAPGDAGLAHAVRALASRHHAVLLANHGPVVAGTSLANAQYATEELEETAKLFLMLKDHALRTLTSEQVADLRQRFNLP